MTVTLLLKVEMTNAVVATKDPAIHTARHPNLLHNADTIGPVEKIVSELIILSQSPVVYGTKNE
jgi:hypothetical protein